MDCNGNWFVEVERVLAEQEPRLNEDGNQRRGTIRPSHEAELDDDVGYLLYHDKKVKLEREGKEEDTEKMEEESVDHSPSLESPVASSSNSFPGIGMEKVLTKRIVKKEPFCRHFADLSLPTPAYKFSNGSRSKKSSINVGVEAAIPGPSSGSANMEVEDEDDVGGDNDITGQPPGFHGYLPEGENWHRCPYDSTHVYLPKVHLPNCRVNYLQRMKRLGKTADIVVCRFNCGFHFPICRIPGHERTCQNRPANN